jgi:hypothetical protein
LLLLLLQVRVLLLLQVRVLLLLLLSRPLLPPALGCQSHPCKKTEQMTLL